MRRRLLPRRVGQVLAAIGVFCVGLLLGPEAVPLIAFYLAAMVVTLAAAFLFGEPGAF